MKTMHNFDGRLYALAFYNLVMMREAAPEYKTYTQEIVNIFVNIQSGECAAPRTSPDNI